jgi:hypothetical protein
MRLISPTITSLLLILTLGELTTPAQSPQQPAPTLTQILQAIEANLNAYHNGIPSFFCDEHVVSKMVPGPRSQNATTDSSFRVKRFTNPDDTTTLAETREVKTIDGHTAQGEDITGPAIFRGAFSGGPVIVSLSQQACMQYTMQPIQQGRPYVVEFTSLPKSERATYCVLQEDGYGRAVIDPETLQVTHVEFTVPNHTIFPGGKTPNGYIIPAITGVWVASLSTMPVSCSKEKPSGCP